MGLEEMPAKLVGRRLDILFPVMRAGRGCRWIHRASLISARLPTCRPFAIACEQEAIDWRNRSRKVGRDEGGPKEQPPKMTNDYLCMAYATAAGRPGGENDRSLLFVTIFSGQGGKNGSERIGDVAIEHVVELGIAADGKQIGRQPQVSGPSEDPCGAVGVSFGRRLIVAAG